MKLIESHGEITDMFEKGFFADDIIEVLTKKDEFTWLDNKMKRILAEVLIYIKTVKAGRELELTKDKDVSSEEAGFLDDYQWAVEVWDFMNQDKKEKVDIMDRLDVMEKEVQKVLADNHMTQMGVRFTIEFFNAVSDYTLVKMSSLME